MGTVRLLLAVAIIAVHADPFFGRLYMNGDMAINLFYMISGFLMTLILSGRYTSLRSFYVNRALRIYPAYFVALAVAVLAFGSAALWAPGVLRYQPFESAAGFLEARNFVALAYAAAANLGIFGTELAKYLNAAQDSSGVIIAGTNGDAGPGARRLGALLFVPQAWTLAIELQFYFLAPFLVRLRTPILAGLTIVLIGCQGLIDGVLRLAAGTRFDDSGFLIFQLFYFLMGILAYRMWTVMKAWDQGSRRVRLMHYGLVGLSFLLVFFGFSIARANLIRSSDLVYALFMVTLPSLFYFTSRWKWDRLIGELSYPIYVFHFTFATLLHPGAFRLVTEEYWGEATLVVTVLASIIYLATVDRRVQKIRSRIVRQQRPAQGSEAVVLPPLAAVVGGTNGHLAGTDPERAAVTVTARPTVRS